MGKQWKQWETNSGGSKITADGDCTHEIKRCLLLRRKVMINLDSILKSRDITFPTKMCLVKAMVFSVVMYGYERWTMRLLRAPWTARRSNQSILKEISPEYSLDGLVLKLKLQYSGYLMWRTDWFEKTLMLEKIEGGRRRRWQRHLSSYGITDWMDMSWISSRNWWWTGKPGVLQSMGSERDTTEQLNWPEPNPQFPPFHPLHNQNHIIVPKGTILLCGSFLLTKFTVHSLKACLMTWKNEQAEE